MFERTIYKLDQESKNIQDEMVAKSKWNSKCNKFAKQKRRNKANNRISSFETRSLK